MQRELSQLYSSSVPIFGGISLDIVFNKERRHLIHKLNVHKKPKTTFSTKLFLCIKWGLQQKFSFWDWQKKKKVPNKLDSGNKYFDIVWSSPCPFECTAFNPGCKSKWHKTWLFVQTRFSSNFLLQYFLLLIAVIIWLKMHVSSFNHALMYPWICLNLKIIFAVNFWLCLQIWFSQIS